MCAYMRSKPTYMRAAPQDFSSYLFEEASLAFQESLKPDDFEYVQFRQNVNTVSSVRQIRSIEAIFV